MLCGCPEYMLQGAVVVTIKQLGGDYGLQKLFGTFGAIIWGPISGVIIGKRFHYCCIQLILGWGVATFACGVINRSLTQDFRLQVFSMCQFFPKPLGYTMGAITLFTKISGEYQK